MNDTMTKRLSALVFSTSLMASAVAAQPEGTAPESASAGTPAAEATTEHEGGGQSAGGGVEEVVVTAQRRAENMQRVPISVAAVTESELASNGVTNLASISSVVPGLVIQRAFAGVTPFLRGVGVTQTGFTSEVPVATYIDGMYLPNAASSIFSFNNIERVEVLKGPQGTLFGRNAVGGLINIVTRDPTQAFHAKGSVAYGNYDTSDVNFYVTSGLTPTLAGDLAIADHRQGEGWGTNLATGRDLYKSRDISVASKLIWEAGDATTVTLRGFHNRTRGDLGAVFAVYPGSVGTDGTSYVNTYDKFSRIAPFNDTDQTNTGLKIEHGLGFATLISLTGFNHIHNDVYGEVNGIAGNLIPGQGVVNLRNDGRSTTYTQELQLQSQEGPNGLSWIAGLFYMHDRLDLRSDVFPTCIAGVCNAAPTPIRSFGEQTLDSYAVFGEATLQIVQDTKLTMGLRYTRDDKDLSDARREPLPGYTNSVASLPPPNFFGDIGSNVDPEATFSKLTWRGVLTHELNSDSMVYLSANRGFKAGAYNPTSFTNPVIGPEVLDAFELGTKNTFLDNALRLNLDAFYYNYKGIQLRTIAPPAPPGQAILYNAASAHFKGLEAELIAVPTSGVTLSASAAYLDATFASFPGGTCTSPRAIGGAVLGGTQTAPCVLDDYRLPRAPKLTANVAVAYTLPTSLGSFTFDARDAYNSGYYWEVDNRLRQKRYHQLNASVTWDSPNDAFYAQLFARNINQPEYFWAVTEGSAGTDVFSAGEPRTYGLKIGFNR